MNPWPDEKLEADMRRDVHKVEEMGQLASEPSKNLAAHVRMLLARIRDLERTAPPAQEPPKWEWLSLRDFLAAQALAGLLVGCNDRDYEPGDHACTAYQYADAMLAARKESTNA